MQSIVQRMRGWLLPTMLILFILEILLLPIAIGITYGGPSEGPNHILSYYAGELYWDSATGIRPDGTAELSLFNDLFAGVDEQDGVKVIAPGSQGKAVVRLVNDGSVNVTFTAVLYQIQSNELLNVNASLNGNMLTNAERVFLPKGLENADVVRAVTGTLTAWSFQDFSVEYIWPFSGSDEADTIVGDSAAFSKTEDITLGLYIVVEDLSLVNHDPNPPDDPGDDYPDPGDIIDPDLPTQSDDAETVDLDDELQAPAEDSTEYSEDPEWLVRPEVPATGSNNLLCSYLVLTAISGGLLLFLYISGRDKRSDKA